MGAVSPQMDHSSVSKSLAQALMEKERVANRLQRLLSILPGGVVVLDATGCVQECNPTAVELVGEPLLGENWLDVIHRAFAPLREDGFEISLRDGRRISIATQSLDSEPGQILLLTDHTETRALQERLNHYQRLSEMGKMSAALAHQIRTPLSAALLYAAHLTDSSLPEARRVEFAKKVKERLHRLEAEIKNMLVFSKGGNVVVSPLTTQELVHDLSALTEAHIEKAGATLTVQNDLSDSEIMGNKDALLSALQNLIHNALQACGESAKLSLLVCAANSNMLNIILADNGPGMSSETQQRVIEPFYTTHQQGTGLGLPVAVAVAEAHQGELWIHSQLGVGTKVGIRLPVVKQGKHKQQNRGVDNATSKCTDS